MRATDPGGQIDSHDDLLVSAVLCSILEQQDWPGTGSAAMVSRGDPLEEIDLTSWWLDQHSTKLNASAMVCGL